MATVTGDKQPAIRTPGVPPGPSGVPLVGSLLEMRRKGLLPFYTELWRRYGDVFHHRIAGYSVYGFIHPDDVEYVLRTNMDNFDKGTIVELRARRILGQSLLTSEDALWQHLRQIMDPPFGWDGVPSYLSTMAGASEEFLSRWQRIAEQGDMVDMIDEMMLVCFSMMSRFVFGQDLTEGSTNAQHAMTYLLRYIQDTILALIDFPLWVPTPRNRRFLAAKESVDAFVSAQIESRSRTPDPADDLISHFLRARDECGEGMTDAELRDQVVTAFVANREDLALVLAWCWYLLSQHPEVEERLHAELAAVLGGRVPTLEDLPRLEYTRRVVEETMRLYPPVWILARVNLKDDMIGGYDVPAGSTIVLLQYLTHRHPEVFENPERFDPDRMLPERTEGIAKYAFFPFGGGKRKCIGNKYALYALLVTLGTLAQHFRARLKPGHPVVPVAASVLRPRYSLPMTIEHRT